ncbi:MAG: hypothetical protein K0Q80_2708 [Microvirga sp.]|nr:hypothetical protein [Microvirga sp.]
MDLVTITAAMLAAAKLACTLTVLLKTVILLIRVWRRAA